MIYTMNFFSLPILLMSVPRGGGGGRWGGGRGLGSIPMEGMIVEMDRGGVF